MLLFLAATPEGRVFALDQQMLISVGIQLFNACVLAAVLSYLLYKPVRKFLQKRAEGIQAQLTHAEESIAGAEELKALYEQKLEEIERERLAILEAAQDRAAEKSKQKLEAAEQEAAAAKERAETEIRREREEAKDAVRLQIIEVAGALAEKFVAQALLDKDTQDRLFAETLAELEDTL